MYFFLLIHKTLNINNVRRKRDRLALGVVIKSGISSSAAGRGGLSSGQLHGLQLDN